MAPSPAPHATGLVGGVYGCAGGGKWSDEGVGDTKHEEAASGRRRGFPARRHAMGGRAFTPAGAVCGTDTLATLAANRAAARGGEGVEAPIVAPPRWPQRSHPDVGGAPNDDAAGGATEDAGGRTSGRFVVSGTLGVLLVRVLTSFCRPSR